mmetsp:Transcript_37332/g.105413  ORF Transcript_37332/g.105413 Transcript_37332/m.105413 type:complete len:406 (+) Transcript_37332:1321-2538(+)
MRSACDLSLGVAALSSRTCCSRSAASSSTLFSSASALPSARAARSASDSSLLPTPAAWPCRASMSCLSCMISAFFCAPCANSISSCRVYVSSFALTTSCCSWKPCFTARSSSSRAPTAACSRSLSLSAPEARPAASASRAAALGDAGGVAFSGENVRHDAWFACCMSSIRCSSVWTSASSSVRRSSASWSLALRMCGGLSSWLLHGLRGRELARSSASAASLWCASHAACRLLACSRCCSHSWCRRCECACASSSCLRRSSFSSRSVWPRCSLRKVASFIAVRVALSFDRTSAMSAVVPGFSPHPLYVSVGAPWTTTSCAVRAVVSSTNLSAQPGGAWSRAASRSSAAQRSASPPLANSSPTCGASPATDTVLPSVVIRAPPSATAASRAPDPAPTSRTSPLNTA